MKSGEPSVTARLVATHRLGFERAGAPYGDPAADEQLARDVARGMTPQSDARMLTYLAARTAFFDRITVAALDRGVTQVVVVAAGYDGRSLRYARPGVRWFELDHPDTQRDKQERIDRLGLAVGHVSFVPSDVLSDDAASRLVASGLDPGVASLMLCEGIAVYLDLTVLASLLHGLRVVAAPTSQLAISVSTSSTSAEHDARRSVFQRAVASLGEPAGTVITATDSEALLRRAGWLVVGASAAAATDPVRARRAGFVVAWA
ncbi:MAG: class I SAM-dependent methyltransferase [Acidimicrobiales bacterium]